MAKKVIHLMIYIVCLGIILSNFSCNKDSLDFENQTTLKEVATFPVGNIYRTNGRDFYTWSYPNKDKFLGKTGLLDRDQLHTPKRQAILDSEFSSLTPESCMKMHTISIGPNEFDFTEADQMVEYAKSRNMRIHGHVLVWSTSVPEWIRLVEWSEQEYEDWLQHYITTVVSRYKDDIQAWDVVNEPLTSFFGYDLKAEKDNFWRYHIGDDYLEKAFKWAEIADPDALLFLNEVGAESNTAQQRRNTIIEIANNLRDSGAKVDGIGLQFHLINPVMGDQLMQLIISDIVEHNYLFHISELDIQVNFPLGLKDRFTKEDDIKLKKSYNAIVYNYLKYVPVEYQHGITFWGISDINAFCNIYLNFRLNQNSEDYPNLWNADFDRKEAYYGVLDGLRGIRGEY
jgi:endo-1,4-beta-xylanase